jgi:imidazolonepropionase-like amidohydrolase/Tol biopolymer transport system component
LRFRLFVATLLFASLTTPLAFSQEEEPILPIPESVAEKPEAADTKWSVSNPPGPTYAVNIDTTEGTWLSLDVSPDGREIVFDLLGDIYVMPVTGGEAKALTSGIAWDMQPRFSPDGRWIAFTSDRSGGDNIWIMKRDGSDPAQVTKESFRLLNSPAWTPDSQYIVARKHFTSRRSLGAGEMWLYHRAGGDGLQMTKRPNDQKDAGEPAFSPDGRYLYFSQDVTPGAVFEYNKDPNGQIYVIQRLDRDNGEIERFVTGPGGSIRPTPSPDGKQLAFVRRVRNDTVLFVRDLDSGAERVLFNGLDRDMQETWAIHGVYPSMAWTPDNRSIVFWAGGKIHRVDTSSREVREIPFRVRNTMQIQEALRFPVEVAPERFPVRMIRWVEVSPAGNQVAYQALGHIYVRDLPNGTPRRLTRQNDHFEFYPSWSRDGRSIVYTTWNDESLGTIRVAPSRGGEGRRVTSRPGHYVEPAFTPDGSRIVYRATSGGRLTSPLYTGDPGIYSIPSNGGTPRRLVRSGFDPQFGAERDRVYFTTFVDDGKRAFKSILLDGTEERTHLLSEDAMQYRLSPDGRWVAFTERFNAHIIPFTLSGRTIDVSPSMKSLPIRRVSRDAGSYLHWAGDSQRLYWSLGPELFSRDIKDTFAFVEGAPETLPDAPESGINIAFDHPTYRPANSTIVLTGARIITMRGDEVIEDGVVVIQNDRIVEVAARDQAQKIRAGAHVIDVSGRTIMPGLVDVHWHGSMGANEIVPQQSWVNLASLAFGVTTIHDPSNSTSEIFASSELAKAGMITAPRIYSTGTILYGAKAPFTAHVESLDDAKSHLRRMKAVGAFSVKSYNQPRRDQRQQFIEAARQLEMMVVPEGGSLFQHNMNMVVDGHTGIEHAIPVAKIYDDVVQLWSSSRTYYTPTIVVGYGGLWGENYWYQKTNVWENERLLTFVPRRIIDERSRRRPMAHDDDFNHINVAASATKLANAGVPVNLGAHGQREGLAAHWELWSFHQGGMTPMQALRASTLWPAQYLGLDGSIGSIEAGKLADLIVLDSNPLQDIRQTETVRYVMVGGRIYDAATMNEIGVTPRPRRPFFFEVDGNQGWTPAMGEATHSH